jgi:serine phosphatase RsbU (regulator of sigma subunit)
MTPQKPNYITTEDWEQTPTAVRNLVVEQGSSADILSHATPQQPAPSFLLPPPHPAKSPTGHLLVVDDNEMNRDMLSRRLVRQGHTISMAVNGREALEMLAQNAYDLVLLDIMMPEMNGYEVLERMKADQALAHIPVIMITAVDELESLIRCIQLGAEDYLSKPFNPVLLKARLDTSLEKKYLRDQQVAYLHQLNLENERKSAELENARKLQRSMLPTYPPAIPYLDIAARQETASEVGGDYYDFFEPGEDLLRIAIGDATGHGVASGLMVSMTKASLLSTAETDLVSLIYKINATLTDIDLGTQLNMALLLLELCQNQPNSVTIRVSGGGMPPLYLLRAKGTVEEILISGLPLGITTEARYQATTFSLAQGDTLLLASDGLPERFNASREFLGFDRLTAALAQIDTSGTSAAEVLEQVVTISDNWGQQYPLHDDLTLVVVKMK